MYLIFTIVCSLGLKRREKNSHIYLYFTKFIVYFDRDNSLCSNIIQLHKQFPTKRSSNQKNFATLPTIIKPKITK
jgi:hypothetical protein